jgi:hypothetical protein
MTGAEWLVCTDLQKMLDCLQGSVWRRRMFGWLGGRKASVQQRKYRLFICACCRSEAANLTPSAVEVAERFADGLATRRELRAERKALTAVAYGLTGTESWWHTFQTVSVATEWEIDPWLITAASAAELTITDKMVRGALRVAWNVPTNRDVRCALLRDIFGNPFRSPRFAASLLGWNDSIIMKLAQQVYDYRLLPSSQLDPVRLMVLADALEEAGCSDPDILNHCRQPEDHVRGCWVVDALLGKA